MGLREPHDCSWRDTIGCINDRCPLHRGMRTLGKNLEIIGALFASFRAGDNFGFHMGSDETQCTCQWAPGHSEPYRKPSRCEQEELYDAPDDDPYEDDGEWPDNMPVEGPNGCTCGFNGDCNCRFVP